CHLCFSNLFVDIEFNNITFLWLYSILNEIQEDVSIGIEAIQEDQWAIVPFAQDHLANFTELEIFNDSIIQLIYVFSSSIIQLI
ncbi:hypothetical protein ACJX0J_038115, partial [Zea mays]